MRDALSRIMPYRLRQKLEDTVAHAGITYNVDKFFSMTLGTTLWVSFLIGFVLSETNNLPLLQTMMISESLLLVAVYAYLLVAADKRGRFVESVLPDALKLLASNMRSGLTIDKALLNSARPEFGFFRDEIKLIASKMMAGETFESALNQMGKTIKSEDLSATVELINQGIKSGGRLADAMDSMADILMNREMVKKEIKTGVQMYTSLVVFAMVGGAPILFGISTFLIGTLKQMSDNIIGAGAASSELAYKAQSAGVVTPTAIPIEVAFIQEFALISLISTSIIGSMVVAMIGAGNWKRGIKNIPIYALLSILLYFGVFRVLTSLLGETLA